MTDLTVQYSQSETVGKLFEALAKAQLEITGAVKDSSNPFFKSKYADLSNVLDAAKPCHKYGLALIQMPLEGEKGVRLVTTLGHSSGEWIQAVYSMTPTKADPQGIGSCLTYMRRYAAAAFLGIAQVDDDANDASNKPSPDARQNSHKILPKDGAMEAITGTEAEKKLRFTAELIENHMTENAIDLAVSLFDANTNSPEEKIFLADVLAPATRKAIKDFMLLRNKAKTVNAQQKTQALRDAAEKASKDADYEKALIGERG